MSDEIKAVKAQFIEYSKIFNKLDPKLIPPFFHLPSMLMTTSIPPKVMTTTIEVEGIFTIFMGSLRKQNFTRSELDMNNLSAKMLSENTTIVSCSAIRYQKDQTMDAEVELERIGVTYTFRKTDEQDNSWKIVCGIIHDPISNS